MNIPLPHLTTLELPFRLAVSVAPDTRRGCDFSCANLVQMRVSWGLRGGPLDTLLGLDHDRPCACGAASWIFTVGC